MERLQFQDRLAVRKPLRPDLTQNHLQSGHLFLQVIAGTRFNVTVAARTLTRNGFRTTIAPGPRPDLFRVLIGPLNDREAIAKNLVRLDSAGFENAFVRRY